MKLRSKNTVDFPAKLLTETSNLAQIFQDVPIGISLFDHSLRYVQVNGQMAAITGKPVDQHAGKTLQQINPRVALALEPIVRTVIDEDRAVVEMETEVSTATTVDVPEGQLLSDQLLSAQG